MAEDKEQVTYHVRATFPASNEQVTFVCVGLAMASAKAAELRMNGYRDVVMSIAKVDDNETTN